MPDPSPPPLPPQEKLQTIELSAIDPASPSAPDMLIAFVEQSGTDINGEVGRILTEAFSLADRVVTKEDLQILRALMEPLPRGGVYEKAFFIVRETVTKKRREKEAAQAETGSTPSEQKEQAPSRRQGFEASDFFNSILHNQMPVARILHPEFYAEQQAQDALFEHAAELNIKPEELFKLYEYGEETDKLLNDFLNGLKEPQQAVLKGILLSVEDAVEKGKTLLGSEYPLDREKFDAWKKLRSEIDEKVERLKNTFSKEELSLRQFRLLELKKRWELTAQTRTLLEQPKMKQPRMSDGKKFFSWDVLKFSPEDLEKVRFSSSSWKEKKVV